MINLGSRYNSGLSGEAAYIQKQIEALKAAQLIGGSATQTQISKITWNGTLPQGTTDPNTYMITSYSVRFVFYPSKQLADGIPMVLMSASYHNSYLNKQVTQMLSAGEASKSRLVFYGDFENLSGAINAAAFSQTGGRLESEVYAFKHW